MKNFTFEIFKILFHIQFGDELWYSTSASGEKRKMLFDVSILSHVEHPGTALSIVIPFVSFNFRSVK